MRNEKLNLKIKVEEENLLPYKKRDIDSGFDLKSKENIVIPEKGFKVVQTGVYLELPEGYEGQIRPRSGLASGGIMAAFGTIDNGYRGEIGVILYNFTHDDFVVEKYDRIAQLVLSNVEKCSIEVVEEVSITNRGESGFGSSGIKS